MKPQMVIISHVKNRAITDGFVPASLKLGYEVILITDHVSEHKQFFSTVGQGPEKILECDIFNPLSIINLINNYEVKPQVVFSNSDHLQSACALVADYFNCPAKNWKICYAAKNKAKMREKLTALNIPTIWSSTYLEGGSLPENINYPVIAKPQEGVSSMDVTMCHNSSELRDYQNKIAKKNVPILLESYLDGPLFTLETLGDGTQITAIGGFDVTLSDLPHFIEIGAVWNGPNSVLYREEALKQVQKFGVNFGVCHSEFILTANGPVLVEINYRSIGDGREFLLNKLLPFDWFEKIIRLHAGEKLNDIDIESKCGLIKYFTNTVNGFLVKSPSTFDVQRESQNISYHAFKKPGHNLVVTHSNKDYLGMLTAIGDTTEKIQKEADEVAKELNWEITNAG